MGEGSVHCRRQTPWRLAAQDLVAGRARSPEGLEVVADERHVYDVVRPQSLWQPGRLPGELVEVGRPRTLFSKTNSGNARDGVGEGGAQDDRAPGS